MTTRKERQQLKLANDFEVYYSKDECEHRCRKGKRINIFLELCIWGLIIAIALFEFGVLS